MSLPVHRVSRAVALSRSQGDSVLSSILHLPAHGSADHHLRQLIRTHQRLEGMRAIDVAGRIGSFVGAVWRNLSHSRTSHRGCVATAPVTSPTYHCKQCPRYANNLRTARQPRLRPRHAPWNAHLRDIRGRWVAIHRARQGAQRSASPASCSTTLTLRCNNCASARSPTGSEPACPVAKASARRASSSTSTASTRSARKHHARTSANAGLAALPPS